VNFPACQKNFSSLHPLFKISPSLFRPFFDSFWDFFVNLDNFKHSGKAIFFQNSQKLTLTAELGIVLIPGCCCTKIYDLLSGKTFSLIFLKQNNRNSNFVLAHQFSMK
jgi:hypothetical protein